tara:strand:- start:1180 stop:1656 length:477 start_codon:yes stop_codon:yes gene_type:complete
MEVSITKKYNLDEVLKKLKEITPQKKTRRREWLDKRNYIVGILYFKFCLTEREISELLDIERSAISNAKRHAYVLLEAKDELFMDHTLELSRMFPYKFTYQRTLKNKKITIPISVSQITLKKLKKYKTFKSHSSMSKTIEELVDFSLFVYEHNNYEKK